MKEQREPQIATVPPFEASYLRVQTIGTGPYYTAIRSLIDGKLPLIARPFEPRIKSTIEQEMATMFGKAT